jgi:hypothetical protein
VAHELPGGRVEREAFWVGWLERINVLIGKFFFFFFPLFRLSLSRLSLESAEINQSSWDIYQPLPLVQVVYILKFTVGF